MANEKIIEDLKEQERVVKRAIEEIRFLFISKYIRDGEWVGEWAGGRLPSSLSKDQKKEIEDEVIKQGLRVALVKLQKKRYRLANPEKPKAYAKKYYKKYYQEVIKPINDEKKRLYREAKEKELGIEEAPSIVA